MEVAPPHKLLALFTLRTLLALRKMLPPLTLLILQSLLSLHWFHHVLLSLLKHKISYACILGWSEKPKSWKSKTDKQIIYHVTAPMSGQFLKSRSDRSSLAKLP